MWYKRPSQKLYRAPSHLVELYQKNKNTSHHEAHGTYFDEPMTGQPKPETRLNLHNPKPLPLHDPRTSIVGTSKTLYIILRSKEYFSHIIPSQRNITTIMGDSQIKKDIDLLPSSYPKVLLYKSHRPYMNPLQQGI